MVSQGVYISTKHL